MNKTKRLAGQFAILLGIGLLPLTNHGQPAVAVAVGVSVPTPMVEIRTESDFYEPLGTYGRWQVVGSHGRCWIPGRVEADWRPYSDGYWQLTDAGWYWVSNEPWGWATYHYGRWDLSDDFGWYWVPQIQWAPAWVYWHSGGGYIGWSPMYTSDVRTVSPRGYVFVEERHFTEPVRRSSLIALNTTIINKTVVIKQVPATATLEKSGGRKIATVQVHELRQKEEAPVVATQRSAAANKEKVVNATAGSKTPVAEGKAATSHAPGPIANPAAFKDVSAAPAVKQHETTGENHAAPPAPPEIKPEAGHSAPIKAPTESKTEKRDAPQERSAESSSRDEQQSPTERPAGNDKGESNAGEKGHEGHEKGPK